jgi:hypothetical protein
MFPSFRGVPCCSVRVSARPADASWALRSGQRNKDSHRYSTTAVAVEQQKSSHNIYFAATCCHDGKPVTEWLATSRSG